MPPDRDWLDYAEAVGSVAGALAALVALWLAHRSAEDSKRSAGAAERTAAAAEATAEAGREEVRLTRAAHEAAEAERARRPFIEMALTATTREESDCVWIVTLRLVNTGEKPAERIQINVHVPPDALIQHSRDHLGQSLRGSVHDPLGKARAPAPPEEEPRTWKVLLDNVAVVDPGMHAERYYRVALSGTGTDPQPVLIRLGYAGAVPGSPNSASLWLSAPGAPGPGAGG